MKNSFSQENIDDNSEFLIDMSFLEKERPIGVSGLLRVKNDADFLGLCIDSCIEALDELIIVYQECKDNSPQIIEEKRSLYPDKIKVFFYEPFVLSHNLTEEEFEYASRLPEGSIHLLSNYYNYTLSKATYKYAVKIDADQIYFTDKLKMICNAYRSREKTKISKREHMIAWYMYILSILCNVFPGLLRSSYSFIFPSLKRLKHYQSYILKKIRNDKNPLSIFGINLFYTDKKWYLSLGSGSYANNHMPPFNGIGDTLFFEITPYSYYKPAPIKSPHLQYKNCIIENFTLNAYLVLYKSISKKTLLQGGFLWYHLPLLKQENYSSNLKIYDDKKYMQLTYACQLSYRELEKKLAEPMRRWMRFWYSMFWDIEKTTFPKKYLTDIERSIKS